VKQQYLPDRIKNKVYYKPKKTGKFEHALSAIYDKILGRTKSSSASSSPDRN